MVVSNRSLLFEGSIFRFHVNFRGWNAHPKTCRSKVVTNQREHPENKNPKFPSWTCLGCLHPWALEVLLLMAEIRRFHQLRLVVEIPLFIGFQHHPWCRISAINSINHSTFPNLPVNLPCHIRRKVDSPSPLRIRITISRWLNQPIWRIC